MVSDKFMKLPEADIKSFSDAVFYSLAALVKYCFHLSKMIFISLRRRVISAIYKPTYHADKKGPLNHYSLFLK